MLAEQRELTLLGLRDLGARWAHQPATSRIRVGGGEPGTQSLLGNPTERFHGVALLNPTAKTVFLGFGPSGSVGSALLCPPGTGLIWPAEYTDLSVTVSPADAALAAGEVLLLRLPYPPAAPELFPYGATPTLLNTASGNPEAQRTPTIFIPLAQGGTEFKAGTPVVLWTPEAGKRFRLLGFDLALAAATGSFTFRDAGTAFFRHLLLAGDPPTGGVIGGNGYLSKVAGNALEGEMPETAKVSGTIWGCEE
jgi:hypothetical protein